MSGISIGSGLQARPQKKTEQERQRVEALTRSELKKLAGNLRQSLEDEGTSSNCTISCLI